MAARVGPAVHPEAKTVVEPQGKVAPERADKVVSMDPPERALHATVG